MPVAGLKSLLVKNGMKASIRGVVEKHELVRLAEAAVNKMAGEFVTKYDLMCNIVHDSPSGQNKEGNMDPLTGGSYRVHLHHQETDQWCERDRTDGGGPAERACRRCWLSLRVHAVHVGASAGGAT